MTERQIDEDRIDDAVLALMYLGLHEDDPESGLARAWKSYDWDVTSRLHAKGLIFDPINKAKSVLLTQEGRRRCEALFWELFAKRHG